MKSRIITGAVYVVVLIALIALKWLVPGGWGALGFDALFLLISVMGCIELLNAFKVVSFPHRAVTISFCAVAVPLYVLSVMLAGDSLSGLFAVLMGILVYVLVLAVFYFTKFGESNLKSFLLSLFAMAYCGILCVVLAAVNHLSENSVAAVLLMFFVIMFTDSGALIFGKLFKRWLPYKLAPKISPNKTIIGGVGGLLGGMLGAIAAYYIYYGLGLVLETPLVYGGSIPAVVAFLLIGLVAAIFDQAGDLFESGIKRKCDIKDMGKVLPGHGGILDRFDSLLFCGVIILLSFALILI